MCRTRQAGLDIALSALAALITASFAAWAAAPLTAAGATSRTSPASFTTTAGYLSGVAATSATNAWAVGGAHDDTLLVMHWNGTSWSRVRAPRLHGAAFLQSVAASSARDAWAVGAVGNRTLILHWNGVSWKRVPSPSPAGSPQLTSVTVSTRGAAWAVGFRHTRNGPVYLILHWTGRNWRLTRNPAALVHGTTGEGLLQGVAASSAHGAWLVGSGAPGYWTVFARWNGSHWKQVPSPNIVGGILYGVATGPHGTAWAVGHVGGRTLIMHWNGSVWRRMRSASARSTTVLQSVAAGADDEAWAVGEYGAGHTYILHWNGHSWQHVASPNPSVGGATDDFLAGVAAYSSGAWAVGYTGGGDGVILNWNGASWKQRDGRSGGFVGSLSRGGASLRALAGVSARQSDLVARPRRPSSRPPGSRPGPLALVGSTPQPGCPRGRATASARPATRPR